MKVLSIFDGISCGQIALNRIGIKPVKYYASEVNKHAITVAQANYPNTIQLGDVTKWREWNIDWSSIDLLIGGSPCQGFSFAGKQLAFDDPRSKLFFVYVDILSHIKSFNQDVKFLLENVKMKKEYLNIITNILAVKPIRINSSLVSAQMRDRYYWCNWKTTQPENKKIMLKDIITNGFVEKDKSWCALESWNRFPKSTESVKGRYKRSMMPVVFNDPKCCFDHGWRELHVNEVEQLQTVPINYCSSVKEKTAKGLLGNGWTVNVITHILKHLIILLPLKNN
jgi:site-specific DNA-cytosine methylase